MDANMDLCKSASSSSGVVGNQIELLVVVEVRRRGIRLVATLAGDDATA
jgi:hypothetical protein